MPENSALHRILLFLFSHRFLAITRWELHFIGVRVWNSITFQNSRIRLLLSNRRRPLFLNLGSGPRGIDNDQWVNVDGFHDRHVHFLLDFTRPLPFPSSSFDGVFSEHVFEHFVLEDGERLAREVYRILSPGGCLRVVVPDAELIMRRYLQTPNKLIAHRGTRGETPVEIVNSYFRQRYEHQFMYDFCALEKMLLEAGFDHVSHSVIHQGYFCQMASLDSEKYEGESLYVEASKK